MESRFTPDAKRFERWGHRAWDLWRFYGIFGDSAYDDGPQQPGVAAELIALEREPLLQRHDKWLLSLARALELDLKTSAALLQPALKSEAAGSDEGREWLWHESIARPNITMEQRLQRARREAHKPGNEWVHTGEGREAVLHNFLCNIYNEIYQHSP